jgi:hypothetical protein
MAHFVQNMPEFAATCLKLPQDAAGCHSQPVMRFKRLNRQRFSRASDPDTPVPSKRCALTLRFDHST